MQTARIVRIFDRITRYVKAKEDKMLIGVLLKTGRLFIDQFLKHSIPFFTKVFKTHTSDIIGIFKDFQTSTRALQVNYGLFAQSFVERCSLTLFLYC